MDLKNEVVIISGGLGDIGRAIALELARHGAAIAVGDILPASRSKPLLKQLGPRSRYDRVDVSNAKAVARWLKNVEKSLGLPTIIIPNAAIVTRAPFRKLTTAQWRHELSINLDGAFHMAHGAALRLVAQKRPGRIIFIGSWAAHTQHVGIPTYCVAKAGLRMLCRMLALDFASDGILVNEVAPGFVDAGLSKRGFAKDPVSNEKARLRVPIQKFSNPEDVAHEVAHLCDPRTQHLTGSVVLMDGGLSLR